MFLPILDGILTRFTHRNTPGLPAEVITFTCGREDQHGGAIPSREDASATPTGQVAGPPRTKSHQVILHTERLTLVSCAVLSFGYHFSS